MGKFALGDEGTYAGGQGMNTLSRQLVDIREQLIPKVQEILLRLSGSTNGIKGKLACLLALPSYCAIIYEGLEFSSIFTLKHHVELLPASVVVISFLSVDVMGF